MGNTVGAPVPDKLEDLDIQTLHAIHANFDEEHRHIYAKQLRVKAELDKKYVARDMANLASFTTALTMGTNASTEPQMSPESATDMLKNIALGVFNAPQALIDKLKKIAGGSN